MSLPHTFFFRGGGAFVAPQSRFFGAMGAPVLNDYGFEVYTGYKNSASNHYSTNSYDQASFTVPAGVTKLRAICIGGGGGAWSNIIGAGGGGGAEAFITVTPGETLTLRVGRGGHAQGSGNQDQSRGGNSRIMRGTTDLVYGSGGFSGYDSNNGSYARAGGGVSTNQNCTTISIAEGGYNNRTNTFDASSQKTPIYSSSGGPFLSGAIGHAGGAGSYEDSGEGQGMGFGGGGGSPAGGSNYGYRPSRGGPFGYRGGWGESSNGQHSSGPTAPITVSGTQTNGNPTNDVSSTIRGLNNGSNSYTAPRGGCGGGAFGGGGAEAYDGGQGASGLIRIWWADPATGDPSWIDTGANYVERIWNQSGNFVSRTYDGTQTFADTFPVAKSFFSTGNSIASSLSDMRLTNFDIYTDVSVDTSFSSNQWIMCTPEGYNSPTYNSNDEGLLLGYYNGAFALAGTQLGAYGIYGTTQLTSGTSYQVRINKTSNVYTLYVDNVTNGSISGATSCWISHIMVGRTLSVNTNKYSTGNIFKGTVSSLRINC